MLTLQDLLRTRTAQPPLNKAMYFNGVNAYIEVNHSTLFHGPDITVCLLLMQLSYTQPASYIVKRTTITDGLMLFVWTDNHVFFDWGDGASNHRWDTGYVPPLSTWLYIAVTRDRNGRKLYVNGNLVASTTDAGGPIPSTNTSPLRLMADTISLRYFVSSYLAVALYYNRALSQSEITHNMLNPNNPIRDGLVLWFDARACDTSKNICYDLSGNNNHGTMYNVQIVSLPNQVAVGGSL